MAHGQPDFGAYAAKETVGSLADIGELAARLGSIVTYDRRGDVVFLDSFESGLSAWYTDFSGAGGGVTQSPDHARNGMFSTRMVCGSNLLREAYLWKYLPYPIAGNLGVEFSFTMHDELELLDLTIETIDDVKTLWAQLRYDQDAKVLKYRSTGGAWKELQTALTLLEFDDMFHTLKVVIDYKNGNFVRALLDERSWDMSTFPIWSLGAMVGNRMHIALVTTGVALANATIYIDDFIVTQNEP
ncbi:hypothetical protein ES708_14011 [subsurface metagenome]